MASILDVVFTRPVSVRVYGLGAVALGVTGLFWGDFAVAWQPDSIAPGSSAMGYAVPIAPLLAGLAMQWKRAVRQSAIALVILYAVAEIFLDVPRGVAHASAFIYWYGVFENLALAAEAALASDASGTASAVCNAIQQASERISARAIGRARSGAGTRSRGSCSSSPRASCSCCRSS